MALECSLPDKLSGLVRLAAADARWLDRDVYFLEWRYDHVGFRAISAFQRVRVGLLGCVMAGSLGARTSEYKSIGDYSMDNQRKLIALLRIDRKDVGDALKYLGVDAVEAAAVAASVYDPKWMNRLAIFDYYDWDSLDHHLVWLDDLGDKLQNAGF